MKKNKFILLAVVMLIVVSALAAFASCDKAKDIVNEIRVEEVEELAYDGAYITWKKVNADYYNVSINGGEPQRSNSTTFAYAYEGSDFEVTVTSVLGESTASVSKTFRRLQPIASDSITVANDGSFSWEAVPGASAYVVSVNGKTLASPVTDTVFDKLEPGSNRIKIKPVVTDDDSFWSLWSEEKNIYIYSAPTSLKYDGETITWAGNSAEYEVTVAGVSKVVKGNSLPYNSENKDFEVSVKALGNYVTTFDSEAVETSYHYLAPVTGLKAVDGKLVWNEVENAEGYRISIDGVIQNQKVQTNSYEIVSGKSVRVKILPFNESGNYFSSWTDERSFYILKTPVVNWNPDLELDGQANNNFTWDAVDAAQGYEVVLTIDGVKQEPFSFSSIQRAFAYAYENVGVYEVSVKAVAAKDDATYSDSAFSKAIRVERLAAPKAPTSNFIVSDPDSVAKGFTVTYMGVTGATSYQLYKDGVLLEGKKSTGLSITDSNVVDAGIAQEQHFTYTVRSIGGIKTVGGVTNVTLSCLTKDALSFDITVCAMPVNLTMSGFNASWNAVAGNNGYSVTYGAAAITANTEVLDLSTIQPGTYNVAVCTRGNGGATLASNYTSPMTVQRLKAPQNIKIVPGDGNGLLEFDKEALATGYSVFIDLSEQALDEANWDNMYDYIKEDGTVVSMTANANVFNHDNTVYYMQSPVSPTVQFIRLSAPVFEDGAISTNTTLSWSASKNINTAEYTPTYRLNIDGIDQTVSNGTQISLAALGSGLHTVTVVAVGNSTKYLDSEKSLTFTFTKIDTPEMTVDSDGYHWVSDANATSYVLEIDGERVSENLHVDGGKFTYKPRYTQRGDHIVKLTAIGNGIDTVSSNAYVYTQKSEILSAPQVEYTYSNPDGFVVGGYVTVTVTSPDKNASAYLYEIAGESFTTKDASRQKTIESAGPCKIRVKSLGGTIDENEVYYIDSPYTQEYSIIFLASPNTNGFSMNGNGEIIWKAVQNADGYEYAISLDGGEFSDVQKVSGNKIKDGIVDFTQYRTIKIKVRAISMTSSKVASAWVEWTWTNLNI